MTIAFRSPALLAPILARLSATDRRCAPAGRLARTIARVLLAVTIFTSVTAGSAAAGSDAAPTRLPVPAAKLTESVEDWYGVYASDTKIGFMRVSISPGTQNGRASLIFDLDSELKVLALGNRVNMQMRETMVFDVEPPYALRGGSSEILQGEFSRKVELERQAAGFVAHITEGGTPRSMEVGAVDFTAADLLTPEVWIQAPRQRGDSLVARSYSVLELKSSMDTYEIDDVRRSMADGVAVTYYDVRLSSTLMGEVGRFHFDAQGHMLSGFLGPSLEIRLESREQAHDASYAADLFVLGMAEVDRPLGDPRTITALVLRVDSERADGIPDGPRQSVLREADGTVYLRLGAKWGRPAPAADGERADNLQETLDYPIHRPEIEALVTTALAGAESPREQVVALLGFVDDFIVDSYSAQPVSVMDILSVRKGDCTEHASLFTTLARSAGIPAREVAGLIYMGDEQRAFGGHAWNEVLLDGQWEPVDPLWAEAEINATHVSFGPTSGKDAGFLTVLSHFAFEVESIERQDSGDGSR